MHIWAHDLPGLFEQRRLQQQVPLSIPTNRLTQRIIPRSGALGEPKRAGERGEQGQAERQSQSWNMALPVTETLGLRHVVSLVMSLCLSEPCFFIGQCS